MRILSATIVIAVCTPVLAETISFQITIPQECFELAQREDVPTVLENKVQAIKARLKLASLRKSDHLVQECRAAVARANQTAETQGQYVHQQ